MAKIFDRQFEGIQPKRLNEDIWFQLYQKDLLWLANTDEGRDLLCIPKDFPEIIEISKRHIKSKIGENRFLYDFRIGSKWANVVRFRWYEFLKAMEFRYFMQNEVQMFPLAMAGKVRYTTTTVYPDPNPESSSVDGTARDVSDNRSWTTVVNAAGNSSDDTSANDNIIVAGAGTNSNTWEYITRGIFLFDTSGISDAESVDSATLSIYGNNKTDTLSATPTINVYSSAPASDTAVANGDYDSLGSTAFCDTAITYAGWSTSAYNDFALNSSGIAAITVTGVSKFGTRNPEYDVADSAPTWGGGNPYYLLQAKMADTAGTSTDPKLVVESSVAATAIMTTIKKYW